MASGLLQVFGPSGNDVHSILESLRQQGEVIKIGSEIEVAEQRWKRCEPDAELPLLRCLSYRFSPSSACVSTGRAGSMQAALITPPAGLITSKDLGE